MGRITIATLLWDSNELSERFSRMYDETWVEKLYRGFERNLTRPFDFVCFTDRPRVSIECPNVWYTIVPNLGKNGYGDCIIPYALNVPMILCGLDTVVSGNVDELAEYCIKGGKFALPRDPYRPEIECNGVALVPGGMQTIALDHDGIENDMVHVRKYPHEVIDDIFPGQVVSYKGHVKKEGVGDARIVYFHGQEKPHQLNGFWIRDNWK